MDGLDPRLRRVVDAAGALDERLLVLLFIRKAEPVNELLELLGSERGETMAALGRLSQAGHVSHHRPEGDAIQWFPTREGGARGEQVYRATVARLASEAKAAAPEPAAAEDPAAATDSQSLKARRRVSIDQNERGGFSWDT